MKIEEFAKSLLLSAKLENKLWFPEKVQLDVETEDGFDAWSIEYPGRTAAFSIHPKAHLSSRKSLSFPTIKEIESGDRAKGIVMHFFMNHELLAIELMALALLRFKAELPLALKRSIVAAIKEEQEHCRLYIDCMNDYGVQLGEVPVNGYFWNSLKQMKTPSEYLCGMSLTFEQANLDYSLYYQKIFEKIGDDKTSGVLRTVYEDEISHVRLGLEWFYKVEKDARKNLFRCYQRNLPGNLSPSRGKGINFCSETRKKIGFSQDFIDEMIVYGRSKGRSTRVWNFNLDMEESLATSNTKYPRTSWENDYIFALAHLVKPYDAILTNNALPLESRKEIYSRLGFSIEWIESESGDAVADRIQQKHFDKMVFWANPDRSDILTKCFSKEMRELIEDQLIRPLKGEGDGNHFGAPKQFICRELSRCIDAIQSILDTGYTYALVRSEFSYSGRHSKKIGKAELDDPRAIKWLKRKLENNKSVVIEPYVNILCEFSVLSPEYSRPGKKEDFFELYSSIVDTNRQYRGHLICSKYQILQSLEETVQNQFNQNFELDKTKLQSVLSMVYQLIKGQLGSRNYHGPFGIDGFIFVDLDKSIKICLVSEVNARHTFGHIANALKKRFVGKRKAIFYQIRRKELDFCVEEPLSDWIKQIEGKLKVRALEAVPLFLDSNIKNQQVFPVLLLVD